MPIDLFLETPNMTPIQCAWEAYSGRVIAKDASTGQRLEARRCFYAGANAALQALIKLGDDDCSDAVGAATIEAMHNECEAFIRDLMAGKA
jgi:hypothetical protein